MRIFEYIFYECLCVSGVSILPLSITFIIGLWNCSDSVTFNFVLSFNLINLVYFILCQTTLTHSIDNKMKNKKYLTVGTNPK